MSLRYPPHLAPLQSVSSDSLLGCIERTPELADYLSRTPADVRTLQCFSQNAQPLSDADPVTAPSLPGSQSRLAATEILTETLDSPSVVPGNPSLDCRLVPLREIGSLGCGCHEDVDYRFVGEIGAGGTAIVFQAHQRAVDREVAVKMLRSELASQPHSRERFLAEARMIGSLDHPNVIALHELYSDSSGALFYSMKRIDGTSWDKQISEFTRKQNIRTLLSVADAIRYAHSRGLIHRDIKPENVMLGRFGEVLLADWGLAIQSDDEASVSIAASSVGGTPAYMAPELATAAVGTIDFRTDVYLLGAILYQIVSGHPPHHGKTLLQCVEAAANNIIEPADIECELLDVAMRAMASNPAERYQDVDAFVAAIKNEHLHEQSERLYQSAIRQVENVDQSPECSDVYRQFGVADALLGEAIDLWPENTKAQEVRNRLQLQLAGLATERGDYALAANIYGAAGESDSEEAVMVQFHRLRRDASQKHVSRYSVLFTQSPDPGLLVQMRSDTVVEANLAFAKLFGYIGDQVVGQQITDLDLWHDDDCQQLFAKEVRRLGSVDNFEAKMRHNDGLIIDVMINCRVVEVQGEQMMLSTIRDISSWLRKTSQS